MILNELNNSISGISLESYDQIPSDLNAPPLYSQFFSFSYIPSMQPANYIARVRKGLAERDLVIKEMYENPELRSITYKFVQNKGGNKEDAANVFSDTIVNFVKNCYKPGFEISSTLENYFFGVTRNLWYATLRKRNGYAVDTPPTEIDTDTPELLLLKEEQSTVLKRLLLKLDDKCKKILMLWSYSMKMQQIAKEMDYKSAEMARKKKHLCLKKLVAIVATDSGYKHILNG